MDWSLFESTYKANFGFLDGPEAWREWVETKVADWGRLKLILEEMAEEAGKGQKPRLWEVKRRYFTAVRIAQDDAAGVKPGFLCRTCGNTGRMVMLRHMPSGRWMKPGVFEPLDNLSVVEICCHCGQGARQAAYSKTDGYDRGMSECLRPLVFAPSYHVFSRAGDDLVAMGKPRPTEADTKAEFATLKDDGWLYWSRETAYAQIELCVRMLRGNIKPKQAGPACAVVEKITGVKAA